MPQLFKYPVETLYLSDFIVGTSMRDLNDGPDQNVTRNFKVDEVVNTILQALSIGTVTSISTASSDFITLTSTPNPIVTTGSIQGSLSATGLAATTAEQQLQFLRGDNTWSLPGVPPTEVIVLNSGVSLTTNMSSVDFTGNILASGSTSGFITVDFPGLTALIDSIIAGAGISVGLNVGLATISNSGVTLTRAGGNVTVSGGTGAVTVNTTANPGTVTNVFPGIGITSITNNTSNPEIALEYAGSNNYISGNISATTISLDDIINYEQITSSNVKSTKLRDLPADTLTILQSYIDAADLNKVKNVEPVGFQSTAKAEYMVTCTINEYNAIVTKDPNTLYFIVGAGTSYTQVLARTVTGITGTGTYTLTPALPQSVTGPVGTNFTFTTSITGTNGSTVTGSNMPLSTTGTIGVNGGTTTHVCTATVTASPTVYFVRAQLNIGLTSSGNLTTSGFTQGVAWQYVAANDANLSYKPGPTSGDYATAPYTYGFNTEIELIDTSTYYFSSSPTYDGGAWSANWANGVVNSTDSTPPGTLVSVSHNIAATIGTVDYLAALTVTDSVNVIGTPPTYSWSVQSLLPNTNFIGTVPGGSTAYNSAGTITGLNNVSGDNLNSYSWNNPATPTLPTNYAWTIGPTFTWASSGTGTPLTQTISSINGSDTLTITGEITYTAPPAQVDLTLNYTDNITYTGTSSSDFTLSPASGTQLLQVTEGDSYTFTTITGVANQGFNFSAGAFTAAPNPVSGTVPSVNTTVYSTLTGTLKDDKVTIEMVTIDGTGTSAQYTSTFVASGEPTRTLTTTGSASDSNSNYTIGTSGTVTVTVQRAGSAADDGSIIWSKNGSAVGATQLFYYPNNVSYTRAITGVSNGDTLKVEISEG